MVGVAPLAAGVCVTTVIIGIGNCEGMPLKGVYRLCGGIHVGVIKSPFIENNRRVSNGDQVTRVAALAMKRGKSVDFTGYWQRRIAD